MQIVRFQKLGSLTPTEYHCDSVYYDSDEQGWVISEEPKTIIKEEDVEWLRIIPSSCSFL